ncbi:hypothetical protein HF888_06030 [Bermanella marisrubri]|uniref:Uncharacterized protein n=1 Tax=Bermanella marisrubri TaxID=207949 RepID=Q1N0R2_9GAMM|nr:hypothetical protein [Bermanella marisrubri]EAT11771.1 hypothetical protein RED65_05274 [Oceanobacter sp. RED65] [Bermanella marisrubri]QIZ83806.1 hypothetical protein HF888_06030 [Bermanella marisrubri]
MEIFKPVLVLALTVSLVGCWLIEENESEEATPPPVPFFHNERSYDGHFKLNKSHNLTLRKGPVKWDIDESGFSPLLEASFVLNSRKKGMWPKAWVAFNIHLFWKKEALAHIPRSGVMVDHELKISFRQSLPKFGIKPQDLHVEIEPIAWMPAFPLQID